MPLDAAQTEAARKEWSRATFETGRPANFGKSDIEAAIASTATWIEANDANYKTVLTSNAAAFSGDTTNQEKARLFRIVVKALYGD